MKGRQPDTEPDEPARESKPEVLDPALREPDPNWRDDPRVWVSQKRRSDQMLTANLGREVF